MELYQLKYFLCVAKYENISKAAQDLHTSQPSLSRAIHALEQELQIELLRRNGKSLSLTYEGRLFRNRLTPLLEEMDSVPKEIRMLGGHARELIRVSCLSGGLLLPRVIEEFKKENPDAVFRLTDRREITDWDICLRSTLPEMEYNSAEKILNEEIKLAVHKDSLLAKKDEVTLDDLRDVDFIMQTEGTNIRNLADRRFWEAKFVPRVVYESDAIFIRQMVQAGLGVAFWPEFTWGSLEGFTNVRLKKTNLRDFHRTIYLLCRKDRKLAPAAQKFREFSTAYFRELKMRNISI